MAKKTKNYKTYKAKFEKILKENTKILDDNGKQLRIPKGEIWEQCYKPNDIIRKQLPKYWFIGRESKALVSLSDNEPRWMSLNDSGKKDSGRFCYKISMNGQTRTIQSHELYAICFGAKSFGRASEMMELYGLDAFNKLDKNNPYVVQVNHEEGVMAGRSQKAIQHNHNLKHLCFLTGQVHESFSGMFVEDVLSEKYIKKSKEIVDVLSDETDGTKPILMTVGLNTPKTHNTICELTCEQMSKMIDSVNQLKKFHIQITPLTDISECRVHCLELAYSEIYNKAIEIFKRTKRKHFGIDIRYDGVAPYTAWIDFTKLDVKSTI